VRTLKPWDLLDLEFDDENVAHLAEHDISENEAREVFWNDPGWARDKKSLPGDWYMIGWTNAGRALAIVVQVTERGRVRPFTGWSPTKAESRYLPRRK
jgi:hypothetical protein